MKRSHKKMSLITLTVVAFIGSYNAVVINSESHISGTELRFMKRLDEVLGVTTPGRKAASVNLSMPVEQKVLAQKFIAKVTVPTIRAAAPATMTSPSLAPAAEETASLQEDMNLSLIEVINPKLWKQGLKKDQFNGSLLANNGVIESLNVTLPDGGFSVSFAEMTGNVFEYDYNGEIYTGMMYQVDPKSYMVTLSNGPLSGTRFKFLTSSDEVDQSMPDMPSSEFVADAKEVEVGNFGEESLEKSIQAQEAPATNDHMQANSFNMSEQPESAIN